MGDFTAALSNNTSGCYEAILGRSDLCRNILIADIPREAVVEQYC